ncbi:hypothetical protein B0H19DRAFT_1104163 [Mycena capillaripes]|nr:hypothetical protein B0H19DRAFT_1104163 [Mycena capillaripes]
MSDGVDTLDIDFDFFDSAEPCWKPCFNNSARHGLTAKSPYVHGLIQRLRAPFPHSVIGANCWMHAKPKVHGLKLTVRGLWSVLKWHGSLAAFGDVQVIHLAALFSSEYLGTGIVDALLAVLAFRLRLSDDARSKNSLIVDTNFSSFLTMLLPIVDGTATGPIHASGGGQAYLYFVLYRPPKHWTSCSLDFSAHQARYGDSLGWERPKDFFDAIQAWLDEHQHPVFMVTDDLPCAKQTDGFNCGIIAVNTIAHNALGDPLWTPKEAKAMRMKAFCDVVKHALSAKVESFYESNRLRR